MPINIGVGLDPLYASLLYTLKWTLTVEVDGCQRFLRRYWEDSSITAIFVRPRWKTTPVNMDWGDPIYATPLYTLKWTLTVKVDECYRFL